MPTDGERGAGHDDGRHFVEQLLAHRRADVERRGGERERGMPRRLSYDSIQYTVPSCACVRHVSSSPASAISRSWADDEILLLGFLAELLAGRFHLLREELRARD